jgi:hypothetical protein
MAKVAVPDRHRRAFGGLLSFSDDLVHKLAAEIDSSDQRFGTITGLLQDAGVKEPGDALQALASLQLAVKQFNLNETDVAESLVPASDEEQPANLWPLLSTAAVRRFAKAIDLRNAYEKILSASRVISDIRPVFSDDGDVPAIVDAAMVNHTLKLTYFPGERGLPGEIHIAVDATDLKNLREQIDRALDKERAARALIEEGGAVVLEPLETSE